MTTESSPLGEVAIKAMALGANKPERYGNPDQYVAEREAAADAERIAADLAAAPEKDRKRLAEEQARLQKLQEAVLRSGNARSAARTGIVEARMAGTGDTAAMKVHDEAEAAADRAVWEANLQADVVNRLRERIVANVRADQVAKAEARLQDARERYQAATARIVPVFDAFAALHEAHALEAAAATELGYAKSEYGAKFDTEGFRQRSGPDGRKYVTTSAPDLRIVIGDEPILTAAELVAKLSAAGGTSGS